MLLALTESDVRARYGRGPWRVFKWLVEPFAVAGIYLLFVLFVLDRSGPALGLNLACAIIPFQLVMMSVTNGLGAIHARAAVILNMSFDRSLLPVSAVMTETVAFGASFGLLGLMMAAYRVAPTAATLWLPLVVGVTVLFAIACAYVASLVSLWLPDVRPFAVSFFRALFFLSPGLIALPAIGGDANLVIRANPLSGLFEAFRATLVYGHRPAAWMLLVPLVAAGVMLLVCVPVYVREEGHFAKVLG